MRFAHLMQWLLKILVDGCGTAQGLGILFGAVAHQSHPLATVMAYDNVFACEFANIKNS